MYVRRYSINGNKVAPVFWGLVYLVLSLSLLKMLNLINISWWYVTMPLWVIPAFFFSLLIGLIVAIFSYTVVNMIYQNFFRRKKW